MASCETLAFLTTGYSHGHDLFCSMFPNSECASYNNTISTDKYNVSEALCSVICFHILLLTQFD